MIFINCPRCNKRITTSIAVCVHCGYQLPENNHQKIEEAPDEEEYIDFCGYRLSDEYFGYLEKTYWFENGRARVLMPIFHQQWYKDNKEYLELRRKEYLERQKYLSGDQA